MLLLVHAGKLRFYFFYMSVGCLCRLKQTGSNAICFNSQTKLLVIKLKFEGEIRFFNEIREL